MHVIGTKMDYVDDKLSVGNNQLKKLQKQYQIINLQIGMNPGGFSERVMDPDTNVVDEPRSSGSSLRWCSLSLAGSGLSKMSDDIESKTVLEAGDIGDRACHSNRHSEIGSFRSSVDNGTGNPIPDSNILLSATSNSITPDAPLSGKGIYPVSTEELEHSEDKNQDVEKVLTRSLEYISYLIYLSFFGILGVGSFLMGWLGVVFKGDICRVSDYLAIGLTTGYLGSLTTFSGWNQEMLNLSVDGKWVLTVLGFFLGLFLASHSIIFGIETAQGFRWLLTRLNSSSSSKNSNSSSKWGLNNHKCHLAILVAFLLMLGVLWSVSGTQLKEEFNSGGSGAQLWLACLVAPPGVWIRWFLARYNGRGSGSAGIFKWVPFGTLTANISAACIMASLSTVNKAVNTKTCDTFATGIQFGFLGCLSTVSTFIAEFNAMRESKDTWRAYAYALMTFGLSFVLGTLVYSVPVWINRYN
ncbi:CRCB domain-containing protein [Cephalotus follicularis]|uniref:CRCB domain-containing protein n=1 Tax=Cephalotus follicularis TaxID=3775 RepID=A0A1Q3CVK7_CEPFO|nr:CRCB domain-containing protein [Cephalotus follicularis]